MIIYTPLALEEVLEGWDQKIERKYVNHQGKLFCMDKMQDGRYQLAQLISTDPNDYMNGNYLPGRVF